MTSSARATALGPFLPKSNQELRFGMDKHDTAVERENLTMRKSEVNAEGLRRFAHELKIVENGQLTESELGAAVRQHGAQIGTYPAFPDTVTFIKRMKF